MCCNAMVILRDTDDINDGASANPRNMGVICGRARVAGLL